MEELVNLFHGFAVALQPFNIMVMVVGIVLGVVIGVLPGLGGANGVAILLPLTFSMPPIAAMMIGFALAAVGLDSITGQLRLTFGFTELLNGFDFLIAVIGLFGIGEILLTMEEGLAFRGGSARINLRVVLQTWKELPAYWMTSLRSCIIGCWMGITPAGATPASFMSYGIAKRVSKNGSNFGKGEIEGVIAPETAAHAAGTSALLPMLSLGVPGSPTAAVLLGGLLIWGLQPGPILFVDQNEFVL